MSQKKEWETPQLEELDISKTFSGSITAPIEVFDEFENPVGGPES